MNSENSTSLLKAEELSISFGGLKAVDHVSFHVGEGRIVCLIGPNGAGKTTVFNLLTGLYVPTAGSIRYGETEISGKRPQDIVRLGVARTFQNIRLFPELRVIENIMIGSHIHTDYNLLDAIFQTKRYHAQERERVADAMDFLRQMHFDDKMNDYAGSLPYGDMRKLEILRAMATGAKLLLLDEPAAGMNPQESQELIAFIREIRDMGHTILLIEHDMKVVMNIADYIYVLDHGKLIAQGLPGEIKENPLVIQAYLGGQGHAAEH